MIACSLMELILTMQMGLVYMQKTPGRYQHTRLALSIRSFCKSLLLRLNTRPR